MLLICCISLNPDNSLGRWYNHSCFTDERGLIAIILLMKKLQFRVIKWHARHRAAQGLKSRCLAPGPVLFLSRDRISSLSRSEWKTIVQAVPKPQQVVLRFFSLYNGARVKLTSRNWLGYAMVFGQLRHIKYFPLKMDSPRCNLIVSPEENLLIFLQSWD